MTCKIKEASYALYDTTSLFRLLAGWQRTATTVK